MTLAKRIEFKGRVEGEVGVEAVKIERDCLSEGSEKDGEVVGLIGGRKVEGSYHELLMAETQLVRTVRVLVHPTWGGSGTGVSKPSRVEEGRSSLLPQ